MRYIKDINVERDVLLEDLGENEVTKMLAA